MPDMIGDEPMTSFADTSDENRMTVMG